MKWLAAFVLVIISSGIGSCSPTLGADDVEQKCGDITCTAQNSNPFAKIIVSPPPVDPGKYVCVDATADITEFIPTQAPTTEANTEASGLQDATLSFKDQCALKYTGDQTICDLLKAVLSDKVTDCSVVDAGAYTISASLLLSVILISCVYLLQ